MKIAVAISWRYIISRRLENLVSYFNGNTYHSASEAKRDYAYDHNLALPTPDNVIVGCLYIGIMLRYPVIKMYGVEYDFIHDLHVDENNKVYFHPAFATMKILLEKKVSLLNLL